MPKILPAQVQFSAGEISPRMWGRFDSEGYSAGLSLWRNFITDPRGPVFRRGGFRYVEEYSGTTGKVEVFQALSEFFFLLVFLEGELIVTSPIGGDFAQNLLSDPFFSSGSLHWKERVSGGRISFKRSRVELSTDEGPNNYAGVYQQVTLPATPRNSHTLSVSTEFDPLSVVHIKIGSSPGAGDIFNDVTASSRYEHSFTTTEMDAMPSDIYIDVSVEGSSQNATVLAVTMVDDANKELSFVAPWTEYEAREIHLVQAPAGNSVYILHGNHPPHKLVWDPLTETFTFEEVVFTSPPADWTPGNYPATGTIYQGRLWLSGVKSRPQTFWASVSGVFEDFTMGAQDDDALEFTMAKYGLIRWLNGFKNLIIGTSNGEHIVTAEAGVITPSDIQVTQQSSYGSNFVQPDQVGEQIFYVSADGRKLRSMQYEWQADNWLSRDLTFISEHITSSGIVDVAWHQNPHNLFWCLLEDGFLACLTYDRATKAFGWHAHSTTGEVVSIASGIYSGVNVLVALISRNGKLSLEAMSERVFMDSFVEMYSETKTKVFTGLTHLAGDTVDVVADGAVHPPVEVLSDGSITLQWEANHIVVGLNFTSKITTLPFRMSAGTGPTVGDTKHWNRIYVDLMDSALPIINGDRPPTRYPLTPMDTSEGTVSDLTEVRNLGTDKNGQITVEQDLPLPTNIRGIYGEMRLSRM